MLNETFSVIFKHRECYSFTIIHVADKKRPPITHLTVLVLGKKLSSNTFFGFDHSLCYARWQIYSFACKLSYYYYTHLEMIWPPQKSVYLQSVHLNYGLFSPYKKTARESQWFKKSKKVVLRCTLFEILIFCPIIQLWFPKKFVDFLGEKLVKMLWFWTF